jgi:hypothetical protein
MAMMQDHLLPIDAAWSVRGSILFSRKNKKRHRTAMPFLIDDGAKFRQSDAPIFCAIVCINVASPAPIIA